MYAQRGWNKEDRKALKEFLSTVIWNTDEICDWNNSVLKCQRRKTKSKSTCEVNVAPSFSFSRVTKHIVKAC